MLTSLVDFNHLAFFFVVGTSLVVQDSIEVQSDTDFIGFRHQFVQIVSGTPFGGFSSFLVEFSHIIQIVDIVSIGLFTAGAFAPRWEPHVVDADVFQVL